MDGSSASDGALLERLVDLVDAPGPQLRAVATTLLVKAVDPPGGGTDLLEAMVASDRAAAMIDPLAAAESALRLRAGLLTRLRQLAGASGEAHLVRVLRDHLLAQVDRWAARTLDDADNRRRAERFLAWADRPEQLASAQRRGLFAGMDPEELRRLAERQVAAPTTPETALAVWAEVDRWTASVELALGDGALGG